MAMSAMRADMENTHAAELPEAETQVMEVVESQDLAKPVEVPPFGAPEPPASQPTQPFVPLLLGAETQLDSPTEELPGREARNGADPAAGIADGEGAGQDGAANGSALNAAANGEEVVAENTGEGPKTPTVSGVDDGDHDEADQLDRKNAFLEEEVDSFQFTCKKCNCPLDISEGVIRGPTQMWCKQCNSLDVMLRRNQAWPPMTFTRLSDEDQHSFWQACKKQREESGGRFSYVRVRDVLCTTLQREVRKEKAMASGGTYLPLSVYRARGYEITEGFEERNPKQWSHGLGQWTYLLAEVSVEEREVVSQVEREIAEAEREVKKRKRSKAVNGAAASGSAALDDCDLLTESEGEGEKGGEQTILHMLNK